LIDDKDKDTIPMAWWHGIALTILTTVPALAFVWSAHPWTILITAYLTSWAYYAVYERMHWCMHLPKKRNIERSGIYFRLNGHHLLHHRYMHKNLNVVFPLADLCLRTLLRRSKVSFKQATGPAVPDVQPRVKKVSLPRFGMVK